VVTNVIVPRGCYLVGINLSAYHASTTDSDSAIVQASFAGAIFNGVGTSDQIIANMMGVQNEDAILGGNGYGSMNQYFWIPATFVRELTKIYLHVVSGTGSLYAQMQVYLQE